VICDACAKDWRRAQRWDEGVPCPHCKSPARLAQLVIFAPRGGPGSAPPAALPEAAAANPPAAVSPNAGEGKLDALVQLVSSVLEGSPTERLCVFAQWEGVLQAAAGALAAAELPYLTLARGGLAGRIDALRRFGREDEPRVLLLYSEAHSSGLNLQVARHVVLLHPFCPMDGRSGQGDLSAVLAQRSHAEAHAFDTQAIGRVRRFPQTETVSVHRLFVRGSVEEELLAAQQVLHAEEAPLE
jgi:SNF2 family DNA or RNA helicase